jgi:hypothetical protein
MAVVRSNNEGEYFELEMSAVIMSILIDLRGKLCILIDLRGKLCGKIWFICSNLMKLFVLKYLVKKKVFSYWYGEDSKSRVVNFAAPIHSPRSRGCCSYKILPPGC